MLAAGPRFGEYIAGLFSLRDHLLGGGVGQPRAAWQSTVRPLARWVKAYPECELLTGPQGWAAVERVVAGWPPDRCPAGWWETYFYVTAEDAEVEFLHWREHMRSTPTADPLSYALALADARPLTPGGAVAAKRSKGYPRFVSLCGWLQRGVGPRTPIYLPVHAVGGLLGVAGMSVSRYRGWAVADGYLAAVGKGFHRPGGPGRADSFRFALDRFPCLTAV